MGDRKRRRERFFAAHPFCCFCGGSQLATTEDHQPGRVFFKDRCWPEGFVFPACEPCNAVSRQSEKVMALLIHGESQNEDRSSFQNLVNSINAEYPNLIPGMLVNSANEARQILREKNINKSIGFTFAELPLVKLDRDFWAPHFDIFSRKLLLALHYQAFAKPLSAAGGMWFFQHSNVDFAAGRFPEELIKLAENTVLPIRQKSSLHDQFMVRWNTVPDKATGLFFILLQNRFAISGVTTEYPEVFSEGNKPELLPPFSWA